MNAKYCSVVLSCGVSCAAAFAADEIDLGGVWSLRSATNAALTCAVRVPGDVHTALLAAKVIPDPYWGCNETNVQWVAKEDWVFTRAFDVSAAFLGRRRIVLEMEDVDTFADVYLNGVKVGTASDRFARWTFDAKGALRAGRNEIRAVFRSAWLEADRRTAALGRKFPMSNVPWAKNQALIRKPSCHAGWDWGLAQMTTGFCGPVKLVAQDGPRVEYVYTDQKFNADFTRCDLTVFADVREADGRAHTVTNHLAIDNPPLWWPNGAGEQKFHEYEVEVEGQRLRRRIGLRKIEIVNTPDVDANGRKGARMAVKVNGRELFMKGANWIPCDAFESRQTEAKYRNLLASAAAANMNMIRLWGGGQFEHDAFYDICDELGILVWHDQMFSCAVYPADEQFLSEVRNELRHQIRRLRDHASIALWCGDNECIGALNWFRESRADKPYYKDALVRRHAVQDEMVATYDPGRMFWPSSPCAGPGSFADNWKNDSQGDMHNWQVWHANRPFDAYYSYSPRFCSEFGYQSFPSMEVAETFASREQILAHAPEFEWHQKNDGGNRRIRETMLRYFQPPKDVESELILSQFQQGMAIKMAVDGWRAQRPRCMGTLFWQLNDNWPVASWSSIEYGGKWKPLQHLARRFFAPLAVVAQPEIVKETEKADGGKKGGDKTRVDVTRGKVFALNDTAETVTGELLVEYWTYDGKIVSAEKKSVTLPPDSSTEVGAFAKRSVPAFLVLTLKTARGTCQNDWHFGFYKDMPLAKAQVKATVSASPSAFRLTLSTDRPAFFVWANAKGVRGEFDDNCLTLLPGRPRTLTFPGPVSAPVTVTHLADLAAAPRKPDSIARKLTPVMGWSSWNSFGRGVDAAKVKAQMDALVDLGLRDLGWTYVNIDDCFQNGRDPVTGRLRVNEAKFPGGYRAMRELVDYAHANGLKAGIYSDGGDHACSSGGGSGSEPAGRDVGFWRHERDDANMYLADGVYRDAYARAHPEDPGIACWGFDFIKIDWCGGGHAGLTDREQYGRILDAIDDVERRTGKQKIVNICRWDYRGPWQFRADSWRSGPDIAQRGDSWESVLVQVDIMKEVWPYTRPGSMNDPDMLVAGLKLTPEEDRSHFAMWCLFSSPLLIGQDITKIRPDTLALYRNAELIALNQDPAVLSAGYIGDLVPGVEIWVKFLGNDRSDVRAVGLLNRNASARTVTFDYLRAGYTGSARARDLLAHADLPAGRARTVTLPPHGIDVLKLEPADLARVIAPRFAVGAGLVSRGAILEEKARLDWANAFQAVREGAKLLDVRTAEEYAAGHVEGAINLPHVRIAADAKTVLPDTNTPIVCYCKQFKRAAQATTLLDMLGYRNVRFVGDGYAASKTAPTVTLADVKTTVADIKGDGKTKRHWLNTWNNPCGPARGKANASWSGQPISIAGRTYTTGFGTKAAVRGGGSLVLCAIPAGSTHFVAQVGVDDHSPVRNQTVRFAVHVDNALAAETRPLASGESWFFAVPLPAGAKNVKLFTTGESPVHASWGGAGFVK